MKKLGLEENVEIECIHYMAQKGKAQVGCPEPPKCRMRIVVASHGVGCPVLCLFLALVPSSESQ